MNAEDIEFQPSRVEGLPAVTNATIFRDRIELISAGRIVTYRFADIAKWPRPRWLWKLLYQMGVNPRRLWKLLDALGIRCRNADVAARDWFHKPADMFFEFYTTPRLKVFMPLDESKANHSASYFGRIQRVIRQDGFDTFDLG